MVVNGQLLYELAPMKNMLREKHKKHGVSYGLAECGYDIRIKQNVHFRPYNGGCDVIVDDVESSGNFTLASAIEEFQMPSTLVGIVHDKSTWARRGLSVFNTVIEAGWKGFLTLELVYHGDEDLLIPAGAGIAQVIFHQTAEPAFYAGKYQNQANMPIQAIME
jgi:dCTP deaminase